MSAEYIESSQLNFELKDAFTSRKNSIDEFFPISRNKEQEIVSIFKDDIWNLQYYNNSYLPNYKLNFSFIQMDILKNEAKKMMLYIMIYKSGNNGSFLSVQSLVKTYFTGCITPLVKYAEQQNITLFQLLASSKDFIKFIKNYGSLPRYRTYISLLNFLHRFNSKLDDINFKKDEKLLNYLIQINSKYRNSREQTIVIPSRILNESLKERLFQVEELTNSLDGLIKFIANYIYSDDMNFNEFVIENKLDDLFEKYSVKSRMNFVRFFSNIQGTCKNLIHLLSGMRDNEVFPLNQDCFKIIDDKKRNRKIAIIEGYTTKLSSSKKKVEWIVSKELKNVIFLLTSLNNTILDKYRFKLENRPLFISSKLLHKKNLMKKIEIKGKYTITKKGNQLKLSKNINIREEDVFELESIEPFRDWRNEKEFEIGKEWVFKSHQYRRSLAVYSLQSGLVSIGCLQIQLKHICKDMSLYYGRGASLAKEMISIDKAHISNEFRVIKHEVDALSYIKNILFSDEKLFGVSGSNTETYRKDIEEDLETYLLNNKEETINKFKRGEIKYKETALGGCVSLENCPYSLTRSIIGCIGCDNGIVKKSNLINTINKQKIFINSLDKSSVEYRTELDDLEKLEILKNKIIGEQHGTK